MGITNFQKFFLDQITYVIEYRVGRAKSFDAPSDTSMLPCNGLVTSMLFYELQGFSGSNGLSVCPQ